ncbi:MAG TPA: sigma-54 dependent transcriptional regulator [Verrucomicrobiae bacterium]
MQSMTAKARILLIEDDVPLAGNLRLALEDEGFVVTHCVRGDDGLAMANRETFDAGLSDLRLPGLGGLEVVRKLHETQPGLPLVLMTAYGAVETAIKATQLGAYDYVQKPFEMEELIAVLRRAVKAGKAAEKVGAGESKAPETPTIIGISHAMQEVSKQVGRIAAKPVPVLIRGETGTGKELIARAIWQYSDRAKAPFVAINCAAIPENLLESELFGHERGAFTGAAQRRIGRFEQAHGGTLFLDEIGDLPAQTQVKLLRVLQEQTFHRVGGESPIRVDVRVLSATHRDLETMVREGKFREDLWHRLNVVSIRLPPLRERTEDVPALVQGFLQRYSAEFGAASPTISSEAIAVLQRDRWPGNIRELENVTRRLLLDSRGLPIDAAAVERALGARNRDEKGAVKSLSGLASTLLEQAQRGEINDAHAKMTAEAERELFRQALALAGGNLSQVSRWLGISRLTLREKLAALGLRGE